jgi:hypothetical protein
MIYSAFWFPMFVPFYLFLHYLFEIHLLIFFFLNWANEKSRHKTWHVSKLKRCIILDMNISAKTECQVIFYQKEKSSYSIRNQCCIPLTVKRKKWLTRQAFYHNEFTAWYFCRFKGKIASMLHRPIPLIRFFFSFIITCISQSIILCHNSIINDNVLLPLISIPPLSAFAYTHLDFPIPTVNTTCHFR